jgi:hypothetical protein
MTEQHQGGELQLAGMNALEKRLSWQQILAGNPWVIFMGWLVVLI